MKRTLFLISLVALGQFALSAQIAGNSVYGNPKVQTPILATGNLFAAEPKGSVPASFIEANVLLNLKADQYQAVFALAERPQPCWRAMRRSPRRPRSLSRRWQPWT